MHAPRRVVGECHQDVAYSWNPLEGQSRTLQERTDIPMKLQDMNVGDRFEASDPISVQYKGIIGHPEYGPTHATLPDRTVISLEDLQRAIDESGWTLRRVSQ